MSRLNSAGVRRAGRLALALLTPALSIITLMGLPVQSSAAQGRTGLQTESPSFATQAREMAGSLEPYFVPGELLVKIPSAGALGSRELRDALDCFRLNPGQEVVPGVYKMTSAEGAAFDVEAAASVLESTGLVEYAQPNHIYRADLAPNDEQYVAQQQWYISQVKAEQAWDVTTGSDRIVVAILDTGTACNHPDLDGKCVGGYDFYGNDNDPSDDSSVSHGTKTAGLVGAIGNNGIGIAGMSWGARIMPVKVLGGPRGEGTDEMVARGIRWAADNGANIINASLGGDETSPVQDDAIRYAYQRNVLFVAAAGNTPDGKPHYPAASDTVMAVGATVRNDSATGFSSYGSYVDISAPGVGILSTSWNGGLLGYEYDNGTSFAAPLVSGAAALVWSINPGFTADQVRFILEDSSDDIGPAGWDEYTGRGRLNAGAAVRLAQEIAGGGRVLPTRTPTPIPTPTGQAGATSTPSVPSLPPTLQLDSKQVSPGGLLAIIGSGFQPSEIVDFSVTVGGAAPRRLGTAQTDSKGAFRAEVGLPRDTQLGAARLGAVGLTSGKQATADFTVVAEGTLGRSVIQGTVRGASPDTVMVTLQPALGVNAPEARIRPDANGHFAFSNLASGFYALSASGPTGRIGPYNVQVDGTAGDVKTIDLLIPQPRPRAFDRVPPLTNTEQIVYFPEVGHTLRGPFLKYWKEHGGLAIFGYPISEEFSDVSATDGKTYTVQYFERNRFEHHPEFAGTRNEVLMGLLGVEMTKGRTFAPEGPVQITPSQVYFEETKHSLKGAFLKYWKENGGLALFGYPISSELVENGYLVQYFERNRFELHLEFAGTRNEVLLGLLGVDVVKRNGWMER